MQLLLTFAAAVSLAAPASAPRDALIAAYPEVLASFGPDEIVWRDGTHMPLGTDDPKRPFADLISHATIRDMFRLAYPAGAPLAAPVENFDPGRFRNKAFFDHLYGDCRKGEVEKTLVPVVWLPNGWGHTILVHAPRGGCVARRVGRDRRAARFRAARGVADRGNLCVPRRRRPGPAVDACLWRGNRPRSRGVELLALGHAPERDACLAQPHAARNRCRYLRARHGFIWGGRWYHYDTMHFEYRPELLARPQGGL